MVCAAIRPHTRATIDVHLMVKPVDRIVRTSPRPAPTSSASPEAPEHVDRTSPDPRVRLPSRTGAQSGHAAQLPGSRPQSARLGAADVGESRFRSQKFIAYTLDKLRAVRRRIDESGREVWLEVDGGVKVDNIAEIARAGADTSSPVLRFRTPDYRSHRRDARRTGESVTRAIAGLRCARS